VRSPTLLRLATIGLSVCVSGALCAETTDAPQAGLLPSQAVLLPSDSRFVTGLDVPRFVASPWYRRQVESGQGLQVFSDLQKTLGLDLTRDVERVLIGGGAAMRDNVTLVMGRFDRKKLREQLLRRAGATAKDNLVILAEAGKGPGAILLLSNEALVLGAEAALAAAEPRLAKKDAGPALNPALRNLIAQIPSRTTFWLAGDVSVVSQIPQDLGGASRSGTGLTSFLSELRTLVLTADMDPELAVSVNGEAVSAASAQRLVETVRGLVALLTLQAKEKPALAALAAAIELNAEGQSVTLRLRLTYDTLDELFALAPKPQPPKVTP
jgi:hypothetical protein